MTMMTHHPPGMMPRAVPGPSRGRNLLFDRCCGHASPAGVSSRSITIRRAVMPELRIKDVHMPELRLPEMSRQDISKALGEVRRDIADASRDFADASREIDLSKVDLSKVDLSKVEFPKIDISRKDVSK